MGKRYLLAASLICADPLNLQAEIERLEAGQIDYIHFDPMDGHFVPRLGLYPEILQKLKTITKLPVDVHLMMSDPEFYAPVFAKAGADVIMVHAEANPHLYRVIKNVKNLGVQVGVCLNPATPLSVLDYVLDEIDWVMLMAINPGIVGHGLIPKMLDKISELKAKLANRN
ncbi:MAG: ribulose-phosphate 3-epimerase [Candidatus Komeilibacteria bacterium]|nr:ribulose-phosphate 3-epimerase [Candidatus Komeilibacteria bacterium]